MSVQDVVERAMRGGILVDPQSGLFAMFLATAEYTRPLIRPLPPR